MTNDTGLPDYVREHFDFVVRGTLMVRIGQAIFFGSSLLLPVVIGIGVLTWEPGTTAPNTLAMSAITAIFIASLVWYLSWMEIRLHKFRSERRASYERWYGFRRRIGQGSMADQWRLAKLQARYVFLGKEPSPSETLALSMQFSRKRS